jgi:hypothetical protein
MSSRKPDSAYKFPETLSDWTLSAFADNREKQIAA